MIKFKITEEKNPDLLWEIIVSGHANYKPHGEDIVCASVSMALIMTANSIKYLGLEEFVHIDTQEGYFKINMDQPNDIIKGLLLNLKHTLIDLANQYPKNIEITKFYRDIDLDVEPIKKLKENIEYSKEDIDKCEQICLKYNYRMNNNILDTLIRIEESTDCEDDIIDFSNYIFDKYHKRETEVVEHKKRYFWDNFNDGKLFEYFPETDSIAREEAFPEYCLKLAEGSDSFRRVWIETDEKRIRN
jgi:uncharacterized protein YsxB (DUF464 family)